MRGSAQRTVGGHLAVLDHDHGGHALGVAEQFHHDLAQGRLFAEARVLGGHGLELLHEFRGQFLDLVLEFLGELERLGRLGRGLRFIGGACRRHEQDTEDGNGGGEFSGE